MHLSTPYVLLQLNYLSLHIDTPTTDCNLYFNCIYSVLLCVLLYASLFPGSLPSLSPLVYIHTHTVLQAYDVPSNTQHHSNLGRGPGPFYHMSDVKGRENCRKSKEKLLNATKGVTAELTPHIFVTLASTSLPLGCTIFRISVTFTT